MKVYLKGHQNYQKLNSKVSKKTFLSCYVNWKAKSMTSVFLMSLEIKLDTYSTSFEIIVLKTYLVSKVMIGLLHINIFIWKVTILLHTEANECNHSQIAVCVYMILESENIKMDKIDNRQWLSLQGSEFLWATYVLGW